MSFRKPFFFLLEDSFFFLSSFLSESVLLSASAGFDAPASGEEESACGGLPVPGAGGCVAEADAVVDAPTGV